MASDTTRWGCCNNHDDVNEKFIKCTTCGKSYHHACLSLKDSPSKSGSRKTWKCPVCLNYGPKTPRNDSTPIRNITITRGSKKNAVDALSPPTPILCNREEIKAMIQEIIKSEFSEMLREFNKNMVTTINKELESLKKEVRDIVESMTFINDKFEDIEKQQRISSEMVRKLQSENIELKATVEDLLMRFNNVEQQTRSNNLELQCMPENKNENLYTMVTQLGRAVSCDIKETDILHCTRVAKVNSSSVRPRSIIIQLTSPRLRDQLLASVIKYNRDNLQDKLNCGHLGFGGCSSPVYVVEHLSPANKSLHAATRLKAKEKNYKYVWVRNGRVFVRKTDSAAYILIKNMDCLSKMV